MKHDLLDITFLIPIRLDSIIRLENLIISVQYLNRYFKTHILVLEAADYNNGFIEKMIGNNIEYYFIEDRDPVFYRTKYLNIMSDMTNTKYIAIWDADVIVPKEQIIDSITKLRNQLVDMIYPYDGHFYDTSEPIRELFLKYKETTILSNNYLKMNLPYGNRMVGGAIMVNRDAYFYSGKENERFYGWSPEDGERFHRWKNLGMKLQHNFGNLYHLSHPRGTNSNFISINQRQYTLNELLLTKYSSRIEIQKRINELSQREK